MNFVKNPDNVKSGKYTPKGFTLPTLPFPRVFMAGYKTEKTTALFTQDEDFSICHNMGTYYEFTMRQKRLLHQMATCPGSQAIVVPQRHNDHTGKQ